MLILFRFDYVSSDHAPLVLRNQEAQEVPRTWFHSINLKATIQDKLEGLNMPDGKRTHLFQNKDRIQGQNFLFFGVNSHGALA